MSYELFRPLLFRLDPEQVHHLTLGLLRWAGDLAPIRAFLHVMFDVNDSRLQVDVFGLHFRNRVGLAAGYDKNGIAVRGLSALGFGHIEIGTVTLRAQPGNPRPRIFRVPESHALINRMGFPSDGVDALRVARSNSHIGINIGKNKDTLLENAAEDYCALVQRVHAQADYIAINVSSPNTPGLRRLQSREAMRDLLHAIVTTRDGLTPRVPLLVKIAPDLSDDEIDDVVANALACNLDGIIATNTTLSREGISAHVNETGGLSGVPLRARATQVIRYLAARTEGRLPIIGVGGIFSAQDALDKLNAGATLIQVYTGLVYRGPGLVREINLGLLNRVSDHRQSG
jgi:dihydroorotate dehydrogenase